MKDLRVGFKEIEDIAQHLLEQQKSRKRTRKEKYDIIKVLMKTKLVDAENCVKDCTKNHRLSKENLSRVVRLKTLVREEFMCIVDREVNKLWKEGKRRIQNKAENLATKYTVEKSEPDSYKGVKVGDDILEKMETKDDDLEHNKAPIYGGIEGLTSDQEEILNLPPNHRTYPKLNLENFKTELEKCVIKANWQKQRDLREHEKQNHKKENPETEDVSKELYDNEAKIVDFSNLRATDLKNNKRVILPNIDNDDEEEIRRNNVKKELEGVFVNFMKENCDKYGNMKENNLGDKQVVAIKSLKEIMKKEELVCFETDKTGKFALDKKENYVRKMKKHIEKDITINMKEVRKIEKEINSHAENLANIVNAGDKKQQQNR